MIKQLLILLSVSFFSSSSVFGQLTGREYKMRGLDFLHANEVDSALAYLNIAKQRGAIDGETLGGLAVAYIYSGDAQRALENAVEARKDKTKPSADAYLAGMLAHDLLGNVKQRDRWMEQGLEAFPGDYLLLYHAGRFNIHFDRVKGEAFLLRSIYSSPGFMASHLLLGESLYRRGENLKAVLPLIYYLMLNHDGDNSASIVVSIERLFDSWAASALSISKVTGASRGFVADFIPDNKNENDDQCQWLVVQTQRLFESLETVQIQPSEGLWVFYSDFFSKIHQLKFDEALAMHIAYSRCQSSVMQWVSENPENYQMLGDWLMLQ